MLAERGDYDARYETHKRMTAAHRLAAEGREERAAFLAERPGLADALGGTHPGVNNGLHGSEYTPIPSGINALHWYRCESMLCGGIEAVIPVVLGWYRLVVLLWFHTVVIHWYR
jgi:hypothetical protein